MTRIDPPNCGCGDCSCGRARPAGTEAEYERAAENNPDPEDDE